MVIGLFIQVEWHWHWPKIWPMVQGVLQAARAQGARVLIYSDPGASDHVAVSDFDRLARDYAYDGRLIDGFVLTFPSTSFQHYAEQLHQRGVPVVLIGRRAGPTPCVLCDNFGAVYDCVSELVARGHRRISFVKGRMGNLCASERFRGYSEALHDAGIEFDEQLVVAGDFQEEMAYERTKELVRHNRDFTAMVAANDTMALGALRALHDCDRAVPEDVEVVGFDNVPRAHWSGPPLSTFEMQAFHLGHLAASQLLQRIRGVEVQPEVSISATYVPRGSTRDREFDARRALRFSREWTEGAFFQSAELARLREDRSAAELLDRLTAAAGAPESQALFEKLVNAAVRLNVPVGITHDLIQQIGGEDNPLAAREQALNVLATAAVDEQRKQLEQGIFFASAALPLRDLSFSPVPDTVVVARFRAVLQTLRIRRSALFLHDVNGFAAKHAGRWWDFSAESVVPVEVAAPDIAAFLQRQAAATGFFVMPLQHQDRQFGLVLLEADSEFLVYYPDLVAELAAALHGSRTHSALAQANRQLEAARVAAERANAELAKSYEALRASQRELVETSRLAGIAEMATGILHNIGNALNSVNTSANVATERLKESKISNVRLVAEMLQQNRGRLAEYVADDPRGKLLLDYLAQLAKNLEEEREFGIQEFDALRAKIEHLNEIVAAQQSFANVASLVEEVSAAELVDYALRICEASLARNEVTVVRDLSPVPAVRVQRQRVLQVLVNLINNARDALEECAPGVSKQITVCTRASALGRVLISVADTGGGIAPENLTRIFAFGFTTKQHGHGFGLHSSALAAKEMGGSLWAESEGLGAGATFTLELPPARRDDAGT